jgi:septal ring-binding cell division protein DamX
MLEGEINEIQLVERLVELWREQFTGAIRFESDGIIKIIYMKSGDILSASTNDRADSIDEILMKAGKVSREHVKQALAKRKESETLGDALLNLGFITRKELTWARRVQVVGVIRSIAAWQTGSFTIVADYLPKRDEGTLFPLPQVLVELIVTEQDRQQFERAMEGGSAVFAKAPDFDDVFRRLGLNEDAEAITTEINGTSSASEVATASGRDTFNAYKLLHALATLGIIQRVEKPKVDSQFALDDFSSVGVADAADMWSEPAVAAPAPAPEPMFQLDEAEAIRQPTLEVPIEPIAFDDAPIAPDPAPSASAWDEPEVEEPMVAPPAAIPPAIKEKEPQWGFDEAQIETARRAAVPVAASAPVLTQVAKPKAKQPARGKARKGSRFGLVLALLLLAIVGGAGYFGWMWWQNRQVVEPAPVVASRPRPAAPVATPPQTATIVPATETTTTTTTTVAATNTAPPAAAAPAPAPSTKAPLQITPAAPAPAPANASKERYDALAREYAANATGNFTVQVQILCDPSNLGKAVAAGGQNLWFVPQPIGARSCYRVFWGRYGTREEAQRALAEVPASLRDPSMGVKPVPKG